MRVGKWKFWIWQAMIWLANGGGKQVPARHTAEMILSIYGIIWVIVAAVVCARRFRDFGYSGKWGWLLVIVTTLWVPMLAYVSFKYFPDMQPSTRDYIALALVGVGFIARLVPGFIKGDEGPNKYGPAPER